MDRRRGAPSRLASSEGMSLPQLLFTTTSTCSLDMRTRRSILLEVECWTHASDSLRILSTFYAKNSIQDTVGRVNRLISAWPTDDTLPAEGLGPLKANQQKLTTGLEDVRNNADKEVA